MNPYHINIEQATIENTDFRRVLYTAPHSQLVLMSLLPGEDIGTEVHQVDQFFRFEAGEGTSTIDGTKYTVKTGEALLVRTGSTHNVINTGAVALKFYTIYSPANHLEGTVHHTKADASADEKDLVYS